MTDVVRSTHVRDIEAQAACERTARASKALGAVNRALVRATDESKLLADVCRLIVEVGGYRLAWVACAEHGRGNNIRVMGCAGQDGGYLAGPDVVWAESERGPMGAAIRTGRPSVARDIAADESSALWRKQAVQLGCGSCVALPLLVGLRTIGGISVYASEPDAIGADETKLLSELANDLAFGIAALRARVEDAKALDALRRSEALYRNLVETAGALVLVVDGKGRRTFVSSAATEVLGRSGEQLLGGLFGDTMVPEDGQKARALIQEVLRTGKSVKGYVARHQVAQKTKYVVWNFDAIENAREGGADVQATGTDITERRHLEEQCYQAQKMESVGRFAGGVAHDFNNVLTAIMGYAELCSNAVSANSSVKHYLAEVQSAAQRAATLTRQLLVFSRQQPVEPKVVDPNELVANLGQMLRRLVRENVEFSVVPSPDAGRVRVDPGRFEQVVVNLVVNASDAMPEGGELTIETSSVRLDREYCTSHLGVNPGEYVMVSVSDTGVGMTEEVKAHLFEPFFTTKPHGTGLGLSTCYGIVKQAGGHIGVYSEVGRGTTMKVYLPRERVGEQARPNPKDYPERTASAESVLVVDDEAPVRQLMASWLLEEGYHVLEAGSGNQALQIGRGHSGPILVIICDLVLPGIEGRELVGQLKALHPEAGVVFASGYPEHAAVQRGMLESSTLFLQKPFTHAQLTSAIRQVIARQAGQAQQAAGAKART